MLLDSFCFQHSDGWVSTYEPIDRFTCSVDYDGSKAEPMGLNVPRPGARPKDSLCPRKSHFYLLKIVCQTRLWPFTFSVRVLQRIWNFISATNIASRTKIQISFESFAHIWTSKENFENRCFFLESCIKILFFEHTFRLFKIPHTFIARFSPTSPHAIQSAVWNSKIRDSTVQTNKTYPNPTKCQTHDTSIAIDNH